MNQGVDHRYFDLSALIHSDNLFFIPSFTLLRRFQSLVTKAARTRHWDRELIIVASIRAAMPEDMLLLEAV